MGGPAPMIIVLALGAGVLGGPDALRVLLGFAGRSPAVDIAICVFVIAMVTAHLLGVVLLARFVRKPRAGGGPAPPMDCFAAMTLAVSVGVALLVAACLVAESGGGGLMLSARSAFHFAGKIPVPAAGFVLLCFTLLLLHRVILRGADNADGGATVARATVTWTLSLTALPLVGIFLLVALHHSSTAGYLNTFTGAAAFAVVVGTVLLAPFSRTASNDTARFIARLTTSLAAVCFMLAFLVGMRGGNTGSGKHTCSVSV